MQVRCASVLVVLALTAFTVACDDDDNPAGPAGNTPGISNVTDDFQFTLADVTNYSTHGGYEWRNTGNTARVTQSSSVSAGTGILQIRDSGGRIVYSRALSDSGTATTEAGPVGNWRIDVIPTGVTGTINFRVQKN
jgi:hypothetical protein